jgi:hypothetical protein
MRRSASRGDIPSVVVAGMAEWQRGHGARAGLLEGGRAVGQAFAERYGGQLLCRRRAFLSWPEVCQWSYRVARCDAACEPCQIGCIM